MTAGNDLCREPWARSGAGQTASRGGEPEEETGGDQAGERGIQEVAGAPDFITALWGTFRGLQGTLPVFLHLFSSIFMEIG